MLKDWTRRRTSAQALALRARIVLMASETLWSKGEIAEALDVARPTVLRGMPTSIHHGKHDHAFGLAHFTGTPSQSRL